MANSEPNSQRETGGVGRIKFVVEKATLDDDINNMASTGAAASDPSNNENDNTTDVRIPLNSSGGGGKSFDFYEGQQEKHVGTFLSSILNFNSLIPSSKEISESEKARRAQQQQAKLGTVLGVFLPCVQNIFGVILFIRASWVVGVAGTFQAFLIVLMCCSCTLLTAISTSAIATNGIVPAGGPYFMISRSLGPECGGAVGILFYLGNTVAASMYIVGAVEIFLKYMCPEATLIGNIEVQSDAFHNFRIYGTIFLIIIGCIVCIGIKFVSKLAPISLVAVLISVLSIYAGVVKSAFSPPDLKICVFNQTRLIRYESFAYQGQIFCTNDRYCTHTSTNQTLDCPLWKEYCGKLYRKDYDNATQSFVYGERLKQDEHGELDKEQLQYFEELCSYFERANSVELRLGIPGLADGRPLRENFNPHYMDEGEVEPGVKGVPDVEILGKEYTSFLVLIGIYFPSVTGIMAGSNRSGDLKDPSRSIPRGTIAAVLTTSFIYLSNVIFFGSSIDGLLLRDKFGDSIDKELVVGVLSWPNKWVIMVGAFLSTFGAGMQSLTSAPRLLQAVSKDEIIPFLKPFSKSWRGEPFYALLATLFLCECGILLGNVDYLTPLIAMFFLLCYGFINMACALQTLLKAPSWRPRYRYYHWTLSLIGLFLCLLIMFIVKWYYAIVAICLAACIYKYIEFKGAEKEWGDGLRGLSMSAARYALLKLEEEPPHVKNWRPQLLVLAKCKEGEKGSGISQLDSLRQQMSEPEGVPSSPSKLDSASNNIVLEHPHIFAFGSQIKAGKGLVVCASVIHGNFLTDSQFAKNCKQAIRRTMNEYKAKGFCDCIVAENVEEGLSHVIQSVGLGGLRPNTIVLNWPDKWYKDSVERGDDEENLTLNGFVQTLRYINENDQAIMITKGIDNWPVSAKNDSQCGNIDVWWIMHDGGLLLLIVFLLKKNKIWHKCKLRLFTIAQEDEDSVKIKKDLEQYMYFLRIDAEVEVIELAHAEVSAYAYEKTLRLHEREKLLRQMKLKESNIDNEPQIMMDRVRRNSVIKANSQQGDTRAGEEQKPSSGNNEIEMNSFKNQFTFSANHAANARRPSVLKTDTIKRMHSAVELNKRILEKSKESALVLMNIPAPPKNPGIGDYNYMTYINTATEGLNRVLLVKGSGREVITIFS